VAALAAEVFEPLDRGFEAAPPAAGAAARAGAFFAEAAQRLAGARESLGALLVALVRASAAGEAIADPLDALRRAWSRLLFEGHRRGEVRGDAEAAFLAELVIGAFAAALLHWLRNPRYSVEQRMAQLAAFVAGGLGTSGAPAGSIHHPSDEERAA
jgi:hypothetical protein